MAKVSVAELGSHVDLLRLAAREEDGMLYSDEGAKCIDRFSGVNMGFENVKPDPAARDRKLSLFNLYQADQSWPRQGSRNLNGGDNCAGNKVRVGVVLLHTGYRTHPLAPAT
jgi:hypothetical protein